MEPLSIILILAVLLYASYEDMRTREVPDWLSYSFIAAGLGLALVRSAAIMMWLPLLESLAGLALGLGIGALMFYAGQWGGGDSKLLIGLGATLGLPLGSLAPYLQLASFPALLSFLVNMLFIAAIYGLIWSFYLALRNRRQFAASLRVHLRQKRAVLSLALFAELCAAALAIAWLNGIDRALVVVLIAMVAMSIPLWLIVKSVEESTMKRWISARELTEGDWLIEPVRVGRRVVCEPNPTGVSRAELLLIQRLYAKKRVRKVLIKQGIPFVPSFLFTYLVTLAAGNVLAYLIIH